MSRFGVKPRFEPRNPMRSARTVSRVIRMTLGGAAAAASALAVSVFAASHPTHTNCRIRDIGKSLSSITGKICDLTALCSLLVRSLLRTGCWSLPGCRGSFSCFRFARLRGRLAGLRMDVEGRILCTQSHMLVTNNRGARARTQKLNFYRETLQVFLLPKSHLKMPSGFRRGGGNVFDLAGMAVQRFVSCINALH